MGKGYIPIMMLLIFTLTTVSGLFFYQTEYNNNYFSVQQVTQSFNMASHAEILAYVTTHNVSNITKKVVNVSYLSLNLHNNMTTPYTLTSINIDGTPILSTNISVTPLANITVFVKIPFNVSLNKTYNVSFVVVNEAGGDELGTTNASVTNVSLTYLKSIISVESVAAIANLNKTNYLFYDVVNLSPYPVNLKEVEINGVTQSPNIELSPFQSYSNNITLSFNTASGHYYAVSFTFENENGAENTITENATILGMSNQTAD